ncbi:MAG: hypothetical protein ABSG51_17650, partial [Terracidiphilus sp.]
LPKDAGVDDDIRLDRADGKESFVARVSEVIPSVSGVLQIRMALFAERVAGEMLADLRSVIERALRGQL